MAAAADWSSIPFDLFLRIVDFVPVIKDYIRLGAVCKWWYAAITMDKKHRKFFPLLMLAADTEDEDYANTNNKRAFYSFSGDAVFEIEFPPEIKGRRCWSSPGGWLVTVGLDMQLSLFNAFSRVHIPLPPEHTLNEVEANDDDDDEEEEGDPFIIAPEIMLFRSVNKAVVDPEDCKVLVIYSGQCKLGFARPGDCAWSPFASPPGFKHPLGFKDPIGFTDIICFNGNFYALVRTGGLYNCDFCSGSGPPVLQVFAASPVEYVPESSHRKYLVDLGGKLCMLVRNTEPDECCKYSDDDDDDDGDSNYSDTDSDYSGTNNNNDGDIYFENTTHFEIYKMDMRERRWKRMESLGDWSVFLGSNYTFPVRASEFPYCKGNCVYFTDDYAFKYRYTLGCDRGIYSFEDEKIYPFPASYDHKNLISKICPPLWIQLST